METRLTLLVLLGRDLSLIFIQHRVKLALCICKIAVNNFGLPLKTSILTQIEFYRYMFTVLFCFLYSSYTKLLVLQYCSLSY